MKLVNIGFGNMVSANRMIAIVSPATHGRRTRAVIITDSDHIILTYLQSETVANRMIEDEDVIDDEEEEDE